MVFPNAGHQQIEDIIVTHEAKVFDEQKRIFSVWKTGNDTVPLQYMSQSWGTTQLPRDFCATVRKAFSEEAICCGGHIVQQSKTWSW
jgi:hypothetical protein